MRRTLEYRIEANWQNTTIKYFLKTKGYSTQNLIALKKYPEGILLNGQAAHVNQALTAGDILTIHVIEDSPSEKITPVELPLDIVYEDEDLMVINKPAGMPIHPSMNHYDNSVANALVWYFEKQGIPFVFRCINRLDRDTSGLTIIAKHMISAGILSDMVARKSTDTKLAKIKADIIENDAKNTQQKHQTIQREYLALVRGPVTPSAGTIDVPIGRKPGSVIERMVDWEHGERAVTHYQVLEERSGHSLVSLRLETGRTHQIRIHMRHLGFPLIGDYLYNPDTEFISRQALHSHRLIFTHPISGKVLELTAPLPEDMRKVLFPS